nr:hypothetical protein [uncultured Gemmiger sp.]
MFHDYPKKSLRQRILTAVGAAVLVVLLLLGVFRLYSLVSRDLDEQAAAALRQTVIDAAVQCYAVEGQYPESLDVLEQEYGVQINHARFIVTYDVFASNQLPDVTVLEK